MSKPKKARHPLDEWSDDDEDLKGGALSVGSFDDAYSLKVTIFWAHCPWRNVKKKEKPDPYCIVKYGGEEGETTQLSATIHPKWNETFDFAVKDRHALGQLFIEIWDRNNKKTDKGQIFLGELKVSLVDYADVDFEFAEARAHQLEVRNKKSKSDNVEGDINLKIGMVIPKRKRPAAVKRGKDSSVSQQQTSDAEYLVDDSYDSILRSLNVARNARDMHADTLGLLDAQGEQLRRIQEKTDDIDALQDKADRHIRSIKSLGGHVGNKFLPESKGKDRLKKADNKVEKHLKEVNKKRKNQKSFGFASDSDGDDDYDDVSNGKRGGSAEVPRRGGGVGVADLYLGDGAVKLSDAHVEKLKQTDQALDELSGVIHDLHIQSIQASDALDEHIIRLDVIDKSVDRANLRLRQQNGRIKK